MAARGGAGGAMSSIVDLFTMYTTFCKDFSEDIVTKVLSDKTGEEYAIKCETSLGAYDWCGGGNRYILIMNEERNICANSGNSQLVNLTVLMSPKLYGKVDTIEVYDATGFLAHYSLGLSGFMYKGSFVLKYVDTKEAPTKISVKLRHKKKDIDMSPYSFRRPPMETVVEEKIELPKTEDVIKGGRTCPICVEDVEGFADLHLTKCGHVFHSKCINEYIVSKGCTEERSEFCKHHCRHSDYITEYSCPKCRTMV